MSASKRCKGSRGSSCATHAIVHSFRPVSALSFLESSAGAVASGQVCATASVANRTRLFTRASRNKRIENGVSYHGALHHHTGVQNSALSREKDLLAVE